MSERQSEKAGESNRKRARVSKKARESERAREEVSEKMSESEQVRRREGKNRESRCGSRRQCNEVTRRADGSISEKVRASE